MLDGQSVTAVHGGTVVNAGWSGRATIILDAAHIVALLDADQRLPACVDHVVDASDQLVMPGGVDPHCHIDTTMGEYTTRDNYDQATTAALWGGTTTVVDFAIPTPGQSSLDAVLARKRMAKDARSSTALHGCVTSWDATTHEQLHEMADLGVRTVKLFTTYRGQVMAEPDAVLHVMKSLQSLGGMAYVHAEANHLIEEAQDIESRSGKLRADQHPRTRPVLAEEASVVEVLSTAEAIGAPAYFVHQTSGGAIGHVQAARSRGVRAYSETCPHYFTLDESAYHESAPERFVCCPPLRSKGEADRVRDLITNGNVHTIGSDHNCFDLDQKLRHPDDVRAMPNGLPGVELRLPVTFSHLVVEHGLSPSRFVALTAANPALLNGLYPRKGVIAPGADADVVVFDPHARCTVRAADLHMPTDYSPFDGHVISGWPTTVISAGRTVVAAGVFTDPGATGQSLAAEPIRPHLMC